MVQPHDHGHLLSAPPLRRLLRLGRLRVAAVRARFGLRGRRQRRIGGGSLGVPVDDVLSVEGDRGAGERGGAGAGAGVAALGGARGAAVGVGRKGFRLRCSISRLRGHSSSGSGGRSSGRGTGVRRGAGSGGGRR